MRLAIVTPDGLSTSLYARSFADVIRGRPGDKLITISSVEDYTEEIAELGGEHHTISMARYISPLCDLGYIFRLWRIFRRTQPDAVLCFTHKPNVYGAIAARLAGIPTVVLAVRGLGGAFGFTRTMRGLVVHAVMVTLYRIVGLWVSRIWFTNGSDRARFVALSIISEARTILTTNAISIRHFAPEVVPLERQAAVRHDLGIANDFRVVVMVARLLWSKGIREFIDAAAIVRASNQDVIFLLVAPEEEGAAESVPVSYIHEREQEGHFRWLRFYRDIRDIYAICELAVLPSYYNEGGYPRALLEPMGMGKAVIAADTETCRNPVHPEVNGFLVRPQDAKALANLIVTLVNNDALRHRFGAQSRNIIEKDFDDLNICLLYTSPSPRD